MKISEKSTIEKFFIQFVVTLVGAVVLLISFFLPFVSSSSESFNMLGIIDEYSEIGGAVGTTIIVVVILLTSFTVLTTLFVLLRKAIPTIIFNIISLAIFYALTWDFQDRGVVSESRFDFGISYYLYWVGFIIIFVGGVWLLIAKIKRKKALEMTAEAKL